MASGQYKKWTKEERNKSYRITKKAEALGWLKAKTKCEKCGQEKGIIHLHNEDYDIALIFLYNKLKGNQNLTISEEERELINQAYWVLCWRCHMIHHSYHRNPQACDLYWSEIEAGKCYPPVFKHDYSILKKDHNI